MASKEVKDKKEKKEKDEKKEKKDDKEKKEKKEKKEEKDEKKEKKEKKEKVTLELWDSAATTTAAAPFPVASQPKDKRRAEEEKEKQIKKADADGKNLIKANEAITDMLRRQKEQKKEEVRKADEKKEKEMKKRQAAEEAEERDREEQFQIMDKSGLGNFMPKHEVLGIMKNTVTEASSSSGSRCQISTKTSTGDAIFTNKGSKFGSVGDFRFTNGFIFIRGAKEDLGVNLTLVRPSSVYVCLSERPNDDDPYLMKWENVKSESKAFPDLDKDCKDIVEVRKKVYKDNKSVSVPKPPAGIETCLVFVVPDFHADPFEAEELTAEEKLEQQRADAAARRAGRSTGAGASEKKEEPSAEEKIESILEKVAKGEKLTNKEKRAHEKYLEKNKIWKVHVDDAPLGDLNNFSLSLEGNNEPPAAADAFVCENFTLSAPKQKLFDNASITIVMGRKYGILGPNGQGKTTLVRHIASRDMPVPLNWDVILVEQEAKATERSAVDEVLAANEKVNELIKREEMLLKRLEEIEELMEKDPDSANFVDELEKTRNDLETTSADLEASGAGNAEARVRKILCGLGFNNKPASEDRFSMDRAVNMFSGGWRMRISLAKALFLQPKLLILDEPTNHLDLDAVLWLDDYIAEVYPYSVIVISHDADFLDKICDDILHLEDKKLIHYRGAYTAFKKMHEQKRLVLDREYKKQQDELKALKKKGKTREEAEELVKKKFGIDSMDSMMEKTKDYVVKFNFRGHGMDRTLGINVSQVNFSYDGKQPWLLEDVEIGVDCGSRIAMVGPNGAGKTTVLNIMMQLLTPCTGEVRCSKGIRLGHYHQHFEELLPLDKTGCEYLGDAFNVTPIEKARSCLGQFGLPGSSHHVQIGNLSGGQKARVAFAALMLKNPHLIILDEPTNHLDIESVEALTNAINNYDGGVILVTHDARLIQSVECDLWVVEEGGCYRFEKDFDGYRDKVLDQLQERQDEVERMEQKRREEREKKRAKHVSDEAIRAAARRKAEELAKLKEAEEAVAKEEEEKKTEKKEEKKEEEKAEEDEKDEEDKEEDEEDEDDEEEEESEKSPSPTKDGEKRHKEYKVAEIVVLRAIKKKKGFFLLELDVGSDDNIKVVSNLKSMQAGEKVIFAPVGAKLQGKEVSAEELHGEQSAGAIVSPKDMGWSAESSECIVVSDKCNAGDFAPSDPKSKLLEANEEEDEDDDDEDEEEDEDDDAKQEEEENKKREAEAKQKELAEKKKQETKKKEEEEKMKKQEEDEKKKQEEKKLLEEKQKAEQAEGATAEAEEEQEAAGSSATHAEFKVAKVLSAEPMKKKKGFFMVELETGGESVNVLTPYGNAEEGHLVILAPEGSKVAGKEVKRTKVQGEWIAGTLCGPAELGWSGDASECIILEGDFDVGAAAPARRPGAPVSPALAASAAPAAPQDASKDSEGGSAKAGEQKGYKVARVASAYAMKKKKGFFIVELETGADNVTVVTSYGNAEEGQLVILAPEGSTVAGKEVKRSKLQGEWTEGVLCGPVELGWEGDAASCIVLDGDFAVGSPAPTQQPGAAVASQPGVATANPPEEDGEAEGGADAPGAASKSEYKVAKIVGVEQMKKKKGVFIVDLDTGDGKATVVTTYANVEEDQVVIFAPPGSSVGGKEVKSGKVQGEWSEGMLCGPTELGWSGDASSCVVLGAKFKVGATAPSKQPAGAQDDGKKAKQKKEPAKEAPKKGKGKNDADEESEGDDDGKKGKRAAKKGKAKNEADDESEDDDDGKKGKRAAKKGKAKNEADDESEGDDDGKKGKRAGAAKKGKAKNEADDESDGDDDGKKGKRGKKK